MRKLLISSIAFAALLSSSFAFAQTLPQLLESPNYLQLSYNLSHTNLSPEAIKMAFAGYHWAIKKHKVKKRDILTIIDFSLSSAMDRLYVINVKTGAVLMSAPVTHGLHSGANSPWAKNFSNSPNSLESSLGVYITENNPYTGQFGYSLRIAGLESSNSNAEARAIIVHSANYASRSFLKYNGFLGNSYGCFAVDPALVHQLIAYIEGGSVLYAYANSKQYLTSTHILTAV
ncbi:MAG: murein L,D-transpeptidase catalytic domain family protein [Proteobacteria bacterium]|nr:murein L,D-transpeptidase catalytic domain family protein [Pseudomonadota bacterium]